MAPTQQSAPPSPTPEFSVKQGVLFNGTVSVRLEIPNNPAGPKPAVITLVDDLRGFRDAGFVAVTYKIDWARIKGPTPPAPPSERRVGKWVLTSPSAKVLGKSYLRGITEEATEYVPKIIDWLETVPEVDANRLAMAGGSTNGFITLQAVAADHRLRAAVVIAACGDYRGFLRQSSMGMEGKPLALEPSYERWIRAHDIIRKPRHMVHAALLMVNRAEDPIIPVSCADATARVLKQTYAAAGATDRFRYVRFETTGHGIGPDERRETMEWLGKWLQAPTTE